MSDSGQISQASSDEHKALQACVAGFTAAVRLVPFRLLPVDLVGPVGTWPGRWAPLLGAWLREHGWRQFRLEAGDDALDRRHYWLCDRGADTVIDLGAGGFGLPCAMYIDTPSWHDARFTVLSADDADFRLFGKGLSDPFEPIWSALGPALARSLRSEARPAATSR